MQLREKLTGLKRGLTASPEDKEEACALSAPLYTCSVELVPETKMCVAVKDGYRRDPAEGNKVSVVAAGCMLLLAISVIELCWYVRAQHAYNTKLLVLSLHLRMSI